MKTESRFLTREDEKEMLRRANAFSALEQENARLREALEEMLRTQNSDESCGNAYFNEAEKVRAHACDLLDLTHGTLLPRSALSTPKTEEQK